jgi:hypothetical protein
VFVQLVKDGLETSVYEAQVITDILIWWHRIPFTICCDGCEALEKRHLNTYYLITNSVAQEHEGSSPHSQQPTTGPCPEPVESNPHTTSQSPKDSFWSHLPPTAWSSEWSLPFGLCHQNLVHFSFLSHACHMHGRPHSPLLDLPNYICGWVQIMRFLGRYYCWQQRPWGLGPLKHGNRVFKSSSMHGYVSAFFDFWIVPSWMAKWLVMRLIPFQVVPLNIQRIHNFIILNLKRTVQLIRDSWRRDIIVLQKLHTINPLKPKLWNVGLLQRDYTVLRPRRL